MKTKTLSSMPTIALILVLLVVTGAECGLITTDGTSRLVAFLQIPFSRTIYLILASIIVACFLCSMIIKRDIINQNFHLSRLLRLEDAPRPMFPLSRVWNNSTEVLPENKNPTLELSQINIIRVSLDEPNGVGSEVEKPGIEQPREDDKCRSSSHGELVLLESENEEITIGTILNGHVAVLDNLESVRGEMTELRKTLQALIEERDANIMLASEIAGNCYQVASESEVIIRKLLKKEIERSKQTARNAPRTVNTESKMYSYSHTVVKPRNNTMNCKNCDQTPCLQRQQNSVVCLSNTRRPVTSSPQFRDFWVNRYLYQ